MGTVPCAEGLDIAQMTIFTRFRAHPAESPMSLLKYWKTDSRFQREIKGPRYSQERKTKWKDS